MARPGPPQQANARRNAALALLADDPSQAEYLVDRIVREDVHPHEVSVIRQALFEHGRASLLTPRLWRLLAERRGSSPAEPGRRRRPGVFQSRRPAVGRARPTDRSRAGLEEPVVDRRLAGGLSAGTAVVVTARSARFSATRPARAERRSPIACWSISRSSRATLLAIRTWRN